MTYTVIEVHEQKIGIATIWKHGWSFEPLPEKPNFYALVVNGEVRAHFLWLENHWQIKYSLINPDSHTLFIDGNQLALVNTPEWIQLSAPFLIFITASSTFIKTDGILVQLLLAQDPPTFDELQEASDNEQHGYLSKALKIWEITGEGGEVVPSDFYDSISIAVFSRMKEVFPRKISEVLLPSPEK